jgi:hypothetical protein
VARGGGMTGGPGLSASGGRGARADSGRGVVGPVKGRDVA